MSQEQELAEKMRQLEEGLRKLAEDQRKLAEERQEDQRELAEARQREIESQKRQSELEQKVKAYELIDSKQGKYFKVFMSEQRLPSAKEFVAATSSCKSTKTSLSRPAISTRFTKCDIVVTDDWPNLNIEIGDLKEKIPNDFYDINRNMVFSPGTEEGCVQKAVVTLLEMILSGLDEFSGKARVSIERETIYNGHKADGWIFHLLSLCGAIEVKKPLLPRAKQTALKDPTFHQLYAYLVIVSSYYCNTIALGLVGTFEEFALCSNRPLQEVIDAVMEPQTPQKHPNQPSCDATPRKTNRNRSNKNSPKTTNYQVVNADVNDGDESDENDGEEEVNGDDEEEEEEKETLAEPKGTIYRSKTYTHDTQEDEDELIGALAWWLRALPKLPRGHLETVTRDNMMGKPLIRFSKDIPTSSIGYLTTPVTFKPFPSEAPDDIFLLGPLGSGADGNVCLVCDSQGRTGALKTFKTRDLTGGEAERNFWNDMNGDFLQRHGLCVTWGKWSSYHRLLMPVLGQFVTQQDRADALPLIRKELERLNNGGFIHGDVAWRNIGVFKGEIVMFDFTRASVDQNDTWVDAAMKKLEATTKL